VRFKHEIEAMQRLDHPYVMPILEIDRERAWYAMPLAENTFRRFRSASPNAWNELRKILSGLSGALMHSHANGFVHRDASPDNLLKLFHGRWVLSDFGLVKFRPRRGGSITDPGARVGTEFFSAPEMRTDPSGAGTQADAWSVGALASWFTGITPSQKPSSTAGRYWGELVRGAMEPSPRRRWTISEIAAHLDSGLDLTPRAPMPPIGTQDPCSRCRQNRGLDAAGRCVGCGHMCPY
jgi:serine/threonine protein kinase